MYRYFALVWERANPQVCAAAARLLARLQTGGGGWQTVLQTQGLVALQAGTGQGANGACLFEPDGGVVLGRLFRRGLDCGLPAVRQLAAGESEFLFEQYWGRYVALTQDSATGVVQLRRDPSGALPCFFMRHEEVYLVFSDLEDCLPLGLKFSVDWNYLRRFVAYSALQTSATGLNEVSEVQPGECLRFNAAGIESRFGWNPLEIARTDPIEQPRQAVTLLRQTVRACVQAWASGYSAIIHKLSGGLDSSVVAACLNDAPLRSGITCLNYFSHGRNEDERRYARLMAQRLNLPLIEQEVATDCGLPRILEIRPAAKPWFYMYDLQHAPGETRLAAECNAGAVFSGSGGDSVFCQSRADLAVTDYLWQRGLRPGAFGVALDAARIARSSVWPLLRRACVERYKKRRWHPLDAIAETGLQRTVIAKEVIDAAVQDAALVHPALRGASRLPPGLAWHINAVTVPVTFYDSFQRSGVPERVSPLMSQPLVELCLRIPKYVWIDGGRDRALVRSAFERDLAPEIVRRRAKGMADRVIRNVLDANLPFVRELLLDGWMVKEGLLDRARLDLYLSREKSPADGEYNEILQQHLSIEAWLRSWKALERRAAA